MKIRHRRWLAFAFIAMFAIPTTAFAQAKRPTATATPREREKAHERREEKREEAKDKREAAHDRREAAHDRRESAEARVRRLRDSASRRERLILQRRAELRRDVAAWRRARAARALAHRRALYARWAWAVQTPEGKAEFILYADRMARIHRIRDIAEDRKDAAMIARCDKVVLLEDARHANVITLIIAKR